MPTGRVLHHAAGKAKSEAVPAGSGDVSADIFRGSVAPPGVFDWMVNMKAYLQDSSTGEVFEQHMCGGALIAPDAVLTGEGRAHRAGGWAVGGAGVLWSRACRQPGDALLLVCPASVI